MNSDHPQAGAGQKHSASGAAPAGAAGEREAALAVQKMFDQIAPRYDLLNHLLSCNVDRLWWRRTAARFRHILIRPENCVLDLCCGTGDMALALRRRAGLEGSSVFAADFAHQMLARGRSKFQGKRIEAIEADALKLPFPNDSFALVVSAFGFRNLANYDAGLREILRVLQPGGEVGILDFSQPGGLIGRFYSFYFHRVLPAIGNRISGVSGAYSYLPASVEKFPDPQRMLEHMKAAGFRGVNWTPYTFGIAGLYHGTKA